MNSANAFEDGADSSAEFMIVAVVEALEVHFVKIDPWAQKFEDLRCPVAVGDKRSQKSGSAGFLEYCNSPLAGDERLVIGTDQDLRTLLECVADHGFRRDLEGRRNGTRITESLRGNPVLTVSAMQVATQHAEAVGERAGISVKERLLLDGIALHASGVSPG